MRNCTIYTITLSLWAFIPGLILFFTFQHDEYPLSQYNGKVTEVNGLGNCYRIVTDTDCPIVCNLCTRNEHKIGDEFTFYGNAFYCPYIFGDGECYERNVHFDRSKIRLISIFLMSAWLPLCFLNFVFYLFEECWKKIRTENFEIELV